jgi:hypothetical protein
LPNGYRWCENLEEEDIKVLSEAGRLRDLTHKFIDGNFIKIENKTVTVEEVNEWQKNNHFDDISKWICITEKCKRLNIDRNCTHCKGEGLIFINNKIKKLWKEWEFEDPPVGKGYQLWEDTSNGSPLSPVFDNINSLAEWCENNKASIFGHSTMTKEQWLEFIKRRE